MDLSAIQNLAAWNELWLKNTPAMTYSRRESKIQGSGMVTELNETQFVDQTELSGRKYSDFQIVVFFYIATIC